MNVSNRDTREHIRRQRREIKAAQEKGYDTADWELLVGLLERSELTVWALIDAPKEIIRDWPIHFHESPRQPVTLENRAMLEKYLAQQKERLDQANPFANGQPDSDDDPVLLRLTFDVCQALASLREAIKRRRRRKNKNNRASQSDPCPLCHVE